MKNFNEVDCMSEAKGKLLVCDRCNDQIFLKLTGTENTDGGYTVWDTFERAPDGFIVLKLEHSVQSAAENTTI